jgi:hypothetical protein
VHGFKQGAVLIFSWSKLQEHRLFHTLSLAAIEKSVNRLHLMRLKPAIASPLPFKRRGFRRAEAHQVKMQ